ncbi:MAPEG family protein [Ottowia sp.]|uniref:MAPEG family protein n=1 Tax=Ottowia sp. TaxID=1898956 RepID=UPI0039E6A55B
MSTVSPTQIFWPMLALMVWTMIVLLLILLARVRAVLAGKVGIQDFSHGESARVPPEANLPNRAFMNLLEVPLLFYVLCLMLVLAQQVDGTAVALAWAYVALRGLHTLIQLSYNRVLHRLLAFALSNAVLIVMLLRLAWALAVQ